ncbi:MAG: hypothetical protein ACO4AU_10450 [bacterium]|jgi:hypothetical protein
MSQIHIHVDRQRRVSVQELVSALRQFREDRTSISIEPEPSQSKEELVPADWFGLDQLEEQAITQQIQEDDLVRLLSDPEIRPARVESARVQEFTIPWISELDDVSSLLGEVNAPQPLTP